MQFGITAARIDDIGFFKHAENLGYDFAWVTDSPLLRSNPWAVLALAAQQTQKIRLGTGHSYPRRWLRAAGAGARRRTRRRAHHRPLEATTDIRNVLDWKILLR